MIEVRDLTKSYGATRAVDHLNVTVRPGHVTGFLGPNGAGKSTTMRMILGLHKPTSGVALINGRPWTALRHPMREVGALLDATAVHGGRSARHHLRALAYAGGIDHRRVADVLEHVGLAETASTRIATFSLGMKQRLGIAAALLGDPGVLILDEPMNGLDPDGIRWLRSLLRTAADQGRTVLLSSHLMSEMSVIADHLIVISRGRLVEDTTVAELNKRFGAEVRVRSPQASRLAEWLTRNGAAVRPAPPVDSPAATHHTPRQQYDGHDSDPGHDLEPRHAATDPSRADSAALLVTGMSASAVGEIAALAGCVIHELTTSPTPLEDAFMELTR